MKFIYFLGIDVSKKTLDVALYVKDEKRFYYGQFNNNPAGFKMLHKWLGQRFQFGIVGDNLFFHSW